MDINGEMRISNRVYSFYHSISLLFFCSEEALKFLYRELATHIEVNHLSTG